MAQRRGDGSPFGVMHTGYLDKISTDSVWGERAKRRFVVLTHVGVHWFKVSQGPLTYLPTRWPGA
jgi:hypothetical protein